MQFYSLYGDLVYICVKRHKDQHDMKIKNSDSYIRTMFKLHKIVG